jgi:NADH-quinone oxidoreductase subunit J
MYTIINFKPHIPSIFFIIIVLLSLLLLFFVSCAIFSNNLIYSIFSLIFYFISGLWFFVFFKAEYAMVLFLIIYLGAIVVFFLFVLMLIDKQYWNLAPIPNIFNFIWSGFYFLFFVLIFLSFCLYFLIINFSHAPASFILVATSTLFYSSLTNVEKIGILLYSEYGLLLIIGGLILLVAILGCILIIRPNKLRNMKIK